MHAPLIESHLQAWLLISNCSCKHRTFYFDNMHEFSVYILTYLVFDIFFYVQIEFAGVVSFYHPSIHPSIKWLSGRLLERHVQRFFHMFSPCLRALLSALRLPPTVQKHTGKTKLKKKNWSYHLCVL